MRRRFGFRRLRLWSLFVAALVAGPALTSAGKSTAKTTRKHGLTLKLEPEAVTSRAAVETSAPQPLDGLLNLGAGCAIAGCASNLCVAAGSNSASNCLWKPEHACYSDHIAGFDNSTHELVTAVERPGATRAMAFCAKGNDGVCAWTQSDELTACIASLSGAHIPVPSDNPSPTVPTESAAPTQPAEPLTPTLPTDVLDPTGTSPSPTSLYREGDNNFVCIRHGCSLNLCVPEYPDAPLGDHVCGPDERVVPWAKCYKDSDCQKVDDYCLFDLERPGLRECLSDAGWHAPFYPNGSHHPQGPNAKISSVLSTETMSATLSAETWPTETLTMSAETLAAEETTTSKTRYTHPPGYCTTKRPDVTPSYEPAPPVDDPPARPAEVTPTPSPIATQDAGPIATQGAPEPVPETTIAPSITPSTPSSTPVFSIVFSTTPASTSVAATGSTASTVATTSAQAARLSGSVGRSKIPAGPAYIIIAALLATVF